jgi:hypothetical protein
MTTQRRLRRSSGDRFAVRIGVVARAAGEAEHGGPATTAGGAWAGGTFDLSADPKWRCHRYKILQTIVPVATSLVPRMIPHMKTHNSGNCACLPTEG